MHASISCSELYNFRTVSRSQLMCIAALVSSRNHRNSDKSSEGAECCVVEEKWDEGTFFRVGEDGYSTARDTSRDDMVKGYSHFAHPTVPEGS